MTGLLAETGMLLDPSQLLWIVRDLFAAHIGNGKRLLAHDWNSAVVLLLFMAQDI
jgi:hypothetical protein